MRVLVILILMIIISSCVKNKNGVGVQNTEPSNKNYFEIKEVIHTSNYTYLNVKENISERWVAVTKGDLQVGEVYYYDGVLKMTNFESKELNRTFDEIYFLSTISKTPIGQNSIGAMPAHSGKLETKRLSAITLEKAAGEITINNIFAKRNEFAAKEFVIRGVVVKVNKQVMGKNWVHIQDGTDFNGDFDLTITTQDIAEIGDEVDFKGKLSINKDFGSGYSYNVIMEDGLLINRKSVSKSKN